MFGGARSVFPGVPLYIQLPDLLRKQIRSAQASRPYLLTGVSDMPSFVVGVDGGTTKTIALVADDRGHILGAGRGGNSNWSGPDVEKPMQVVIDAVREALRQAGLKGHDVAAGAFGLAGADWPEDYHRRQVVLQRSGIARQVIVKNDALVGWRAGTRRRYGVVIAAGTGSNTAIVPPDGQEWCYGYYVRYGGAGDVAYDAIHAVLRQEDGRGPPTSLTEIVLSRLGYPTAEALLRALYTHQLQARSALALCPLVFEAAHAGDEVAMSLIVKQGQALAEYATAGIRRFGMQQLEFDVVLAGSLFKGKGPLLIDTITQAVHCVAPRAHIVRPRFEPAVGGVLLAYDALSIAVSDEMYENLAQTMPGDAFFSTADDELSDPGIDRGTSDADELTCRTG
jgi:N-acetylglucosamine kinase-like BadF-type ATPase